MPPVASALQAPAQTPTEGDQERSVDLGVPGEGVSGSAVGVPAKKPPCKPCGRRRGAGTTEAIRQQLLIKQRGG